MRLISWNVAGKGWCLDEQVRALLDRGPDVVALQEVTASTAPRFRDQFGRSGLSHLADSLHLTVRYGRRYGELIASRWPLYALSPKEFDQPYPERVLSAGIESPWGDIEFLTAHIVPGSSRGWQKIEMFEGIFKGLARQSETPRILCGDFNSPQLEMPDGRVITWGQRVTKPGMIGDTLLR